MKFVPAKTLPGPLLNTAMSACVVREMVTVAAALFVVPSLTTNVKLSVPVKLKFGV